MEANACGHTKDDGTPCRAVRVHGSEFCFFHDPARAAQRAAARRTGGQHGRAAVLPADTPARAVKTAADVIDLLSETINQVRVGAVDPRVGNCVGYLAGIILKAVEQGDMEERLAALEAIIAGQGPPMRAVDDDLDNLVIDGEERHEEAVPQEATV